MPIEDLLRGWGELEDAQDEYRRAWAYYRGTVPEIFASDRIRERLERTGAHYRFNLSKTPVNVRADRCELLGITVPAGEDADGKPQRNEGAEKRAQQIWDANDLSVHYKDLMRKTFAYGDAYVMVWTPPEPDPADPMDDPEQDPDPKLAAAGVEFSVHAPVHTRILYDRRSGRRKAFCIRRWQETRVPEGTAALTGPVDIWHVELWYPEVIEHWETRPGTDPELAESWLELPAEVNPHDEIPFFHHRTDLPYGVPVHYDAYGPQNAVTKMLITQITTTDAQGFPQRYGLIDNDAEMDGAATHPGFPDDADVADSTQAIGGMRSNMRGGPGTMQMWPGLREVGQWDAAEPAIFTDPAELYVRLMAQTTTTPLHYFDPSGDTPSGESLKTAEAPLVKSVEDLQTMQRSPINEEWTFALKLAGTQVESVEPRWAPVRSATGKDDWEEAEAKIRVGVPVERVLAEAGYDSDDVTKWLDDDTEAMALTGRLDMLQKMADAVQKLSAAVIGGVLDKESVADLLNKLWPEMELEAGEDPEPVDPMTGLPAAPGGRSGQPAGSSGRSEAPPGRSRTTPDGPGRGGAARKALSARPAPSRR